MRRIFNENPFTVFVLGASQVSIPIGTFHAVLCRVQSSRYDPVVTASSTVNDIMSILVFRRVIPVDYCGIYILSYGRVGSLPESATMGSLGIRSLWHLYLRVRVRGGAGK